MTDIHQPTPQHILTALREARRLIEIGWCKGRAQDGDKYCLVGALAEATLTDPDGNVPGYLVWRESLAAINANLPHPYPNAVTYNDSTDQQAVLEVIHKAISSIEEQQ